MDVQAFCNTIPYLDTIKYDSNAMGNDSQLCESDLDTIKYDSNIPTALRKSEVQHLDTIKYDSNV